MELLYYYGVGVFFVLLIIVLHYAKELGVLHNPHFHKWNSVLAVCNCDCEFPKIAHAGKRKKTLKQYAHPSVGLPPPAMHASTIYGKELCAATLYQYCEKCKMRKTKFVQQYTPHVTPWVDDGVLPE